MLLTEIDDLHRDDHWHLTKTDQCYFLREYIARGGWKAGDTNQLILNLKKTPDRRLKPEWYYKEQAIRRAGTELQVAFLSGGEKWLDGAVIVPMPPSKTKDDPGYDDRVVRVAQVMCQGTRAAAREILLQRESTDAVHLQEQTRDVDGLADNFEVDESLCTPVPPRIAILDDVLTTGAHFVAAKRVLQQRFPTAHIIGLFIARRAIVDEESTSDFLEGT